MQSIKRGDKGNSKATGVIIKNAREIAIPFGVHFINRQQVIDSRKSGHILKHRQLVSQCKKITKQILTPSEEAELADYLRRLGKMVGNVSLKHVRNIGYEYAKVNYIHVPEKWIDEKTGSFEWARNFLKRNQPLPALVRSNESHQINWVYFFREPIRAYEKHIATNAVGTNVGVLGQYRHFTGIELLSERKTLITVVFAIYDRESKSYDPFLIFPRKYFTPIFKTDIIQGCDVFDMNPNCWLKSDDNSKRFFQFMIKRNSYYSKCFSDHPFDHYFFFYFPQS